MRSLPYVTLIRAGSPSMVNFEQTSNPRRGYLECRSRRARVEAQALRLGVGIRVSRMDSHQVTQERMRQRYGAPAALPEFVAFAFRLSGRGVF